MAGLGVPPGYTITIAQWAEAKPSASIDCKTCPRHEPFDVPLDDATGTGLAINRAIGGWLAHTCHVRTDMQDVPAGQVWPPFVLVEAERLGLAPEQVAARYDLTQVDG